MNIRSRKGQQRGQWTLIGLIVAMTIIVILAAYQYKELMTPGGVDGSVASPEQDAQDVACGTYYNQIGDAIVEYKDQHGRPPRSLDALRGEGVTREMWDDPYCKFTYDPQTGMLGDRDVALTPTAPAAQAPANTTAGTPGYNGVATTTAPPAPPPGSAPNTDIYSKAAHSGDGVDGGGDFGGGGGHHDGGGGGGGAGTTDPVTALTN